MLYAIQLSKTKKVFTPSNRYILWIDDNWYETSREPMYVFEEKDLPKIKEQLKNHFIFNATFISKDNNANNINWSFFQKIKQEFVMKGFKVKIKL